MAEETKIIYHIDDEETPYLVKISKPPDQVTLLDFKTVLNRPNYKFFFKSMDDDFGVVKEEIIEDDAPLPCFNGRVVSWVVPPDDEHASDAQSVRSNEKDRSSNAGSEKPHIPSHPSRSKDPRDFDSEVESVVSRRSSRRSGSRRHESDVERSHRRPGHSEYDSSSMMSSDLETTSFVDSDDESRFSSVTGSSRYVGGRHRRRRRKHRMPRVERCSSFSTITESTMSLNIITVTLNMDKINFLGISIVGQSNKRGDGGIYVGSVMKGGAVDADGRVEPGDMLLAVNDVNFENMSNDDAVRVLREAVHKPGPITLTVAKCWDPSPKGYFTVPRNEPVRPIDPSAWIQHSEAVRAAGGLGRPQGAGSPSLSTMTSTSSSLTSSIPEADRKSLTWSALDDTFGYIDNPDGDLGLTIHSDMGTIVKAMMSGESGLDVRDRMWLKITIPNAFIGSDVVDWLFTHVEGFSDRREARKYASKLLKAGYFRHTVNKITFSEQCYYVFGDLTGAMAGLSISDIDSTLDQDTLAPLPGSKSQLAWNTGQPQNVVPTAPPPSYSQIQYYPPVGFPPHAAPMVGYPQDGQQMVYPQFYIQHPAIANSVVAPSHSSGSHKSGSQKEVDRETVRSSGSSERSASSKGKPKKPERDTQSLRESDTQSLRGIPVLPDQVSIHSSVQSVHSAQGAPIDDQDAESLRDDISVTSTEFAAQLGNLPPGLSDSRQSFRMAMGNPMSEFFVDVM